MKNVEKVRKETQMSYETFQQTFHKTGLQGSCPKL